MMRHRKPKGPKRVPYRLIEPDSQGGKAMYKLLARLVRDHHEELTEARIALAWHAGWRRNVDGQVKLGQLKKASDLDRELKPFDFVVVLNRTFYEAATVKDEQRAALLDHELCHGCRKYDQNGEPTIDERGRAVYRLRRHDIEEFGQVVERHGLYKRDLELFAQAIRRAPQLELPLAEGAAKAVANGDGWGKEPEGSITAGKFGKAREQAVAGVLTQVS